MKLEAHLRLQANVVDEDIAFLTKAFKPILKNAPMVFKKPTEARVVFFLTSGTKMTYWSRNNNTVFDLVMDVPFYHNATGSGKTLKKALAGVRADLFPSVEDLGLTIKGGEDDPRYLKAYDFLKTAFALADKASK